MKKFVLNFLLGVVLATSASAAVVPVTTNITANTTWTKNNTYLLIGEILVKGATLTIQPGTIVKADKNTISRLVITTTGKIYAQGTAQEPIIFTSNQAAGNRNRGDWGGISIAGNAPLNTVDAGNNPIQKVFECGTAPDYAYGGNNPDDSSGVLSYVRIEYAGYSCGTNTELNSLSLGGVGRKTKLDHIFISNSLDDAFELWGGNVNLHHIVAYNTRDDDFDTDNGWSGSAQFGLIVRVDSVSDEGDVGNGFESDNDDQSSYKTPKTSGAISNFTVVGFAKSKTATIASTAGWGARIRRNSAQSIFNSIFMGWKEGVRFEGAGTQGKFNGDTIEFKNNIVEGSKTKNFNSTFDSTMLANPAYNNRVDAGDANDYTKLAAPFSFPNFDFQPTQNSPALTGASFASSKLAALTSTSYVGAFDGTNNWLAGWSNFYPQFENYTTGLVDAKAYLNSVAVYPNPANSNLNIAIASKEDLDIMVEVLDMNGCVVIARNNKLITGENIATFDVSNFANGLYFVRVAGVDFAVSQKVNIKR